jgi:hypothetical protein
MKTITNPISNIPVNPKSHVHGWTQVWRDQLNASINHKCTPNTLKSDVLYIDHGVNFGGTLNLFGGATKEVYDKINLVCSHSHVVSLDWDMPDYGAMLKKRIGANTTYEGITEQWCDQVSQRCKHISSLKQEDLNYDNIIVGDSHTIAFSDTNDRVYRNDGKTLFGALRSGLDKLLRETTPSGRVTLCYGSIDIRHHLLRHDNFDIKDFVRQYVEQGNDLAEDVWYCAPVPVEYEDRKIPKSGFYKKTPFYGSATDRRDITMHFIDELYKQSNDKVIQPPDDWYTMDGKSYAETYMEFGSSFHIAPPFYRRNDWGVSPLGA